MQRHPAINSSGKRVAELVVRPKTTNLIEGDMASLPSGTRPETEGKNEARPSDNKTLIMARPIPR